MITGLYGCSCHPFSSWSECDKAHNQKFKIGDPVENTCLGTHGTINEIKREKGFVIVKYGNRPCDLHLEHVANLKKYLK